ncbi:MAG: O-antigen ligase family protein [Candidatus Parcubacteria bacterium]|nr:O-antigen ligase family protein [Candidatus Parcubacteria bacterium]
MKTTENFLRNAILTGIFAVPFLAFLVTGSMFFPFITGKNFGFRIIVEVIFALWVLLAYANTAYRPKFSWIMATAVSFVGIVFLADIFGANPARSIWSNYERMEGFVALIHVFAFFVVTGSVLTKDLWTKFLQTSVFAATIMALFGWIQYTGGAVINQGGRLDGRFGNAAYFGGYLLFNVFLTAFLMARTKKYNFLWWTYACAIVLQTTIMFLTETRGSMLGFFVGVTLSALLFIFLSKKNPTMKKIAIGVVSFVIVFIVSVFQFKDSNFVQSHSTLSRFATISLSGSTVDSRFMVWGMAIDGFKERPILGWGQDNFNVVFNKYYNPGMWNQEQWFDRAHDIFLDWLISAGFLGLFSYLLLFVLGVLFVWETGTKSGEKGLLKNISFAWKKYVSGEEEHHLLEKSILTGLFAAYFVHNIFVFDNLFSYILFFSILAFLHSGHVEEPTPVKNFTKKFIKENDRLPLSYVAVPVLFVFGMAMYIVNIKPIWASQAIIAGIQPHQDASGKVTFTKENLDSFKQVIEYDTFGNSEAREQLVQASVRDASPGVDKDLQKQLFDFAKEQILQQIQDVPEDARIETFAGTLFLRYGQQDEALAHFERAHELSPNKQTISLSLILCYLNAGRADDAMALAKSTYELDTDFKEAAKMYAVTALYKGDQKLADDILVQNFGTAVVYDEDLITTYAFVKKYDKVLEILNQKLKEKEDSQVRIRLAATYLEMGDNASSIVEIEKVMAEDPSFKQQGEYFIQEIRAGRKP